MTINEKDCWIKDRERWLSFFSFSFFFFLLSLFLYFDSCKSYLFNDRLVFVVSSIFFISAI